MREVDVAIIGAGSAGLTARREVVKKTSNYVVIDDGPLGTTCARVGCMPSKTLIQVANDYHRRHALAEEGIHNGDKLFIDTVEVMQHVRKQRDRFVKGVHQGMAEWKDGNLIRKQARFLDHHTLDLGDEKIRAEKIIIAVGTRPVIPMDLQPFVPFLINTNELFELDQLPRSMAVLGVGVIALELGQALSRLGVTTTIIGRRVRFAGISDPEINGSIAETLGQELDLSLDGYRVSDNQTVNSLRLMTGTREIEVDKVLIALGRTPNLDRLNISVLNLPTDERGIPLYSQEDFQIKNSNLFLVGDTNLHRPLLHEAADQGRIAGFNAVNGFHCFRQRVPVAITFCDPNIAWVGQKHEVLRSNNQEFITGTASFKGQGRSIIKLKEKGQLNLYAERDTGKILGAELFAPDGEHLAHLISWMISCDLTVHDALALPFYHPVIEEGLRTAIRDAAGKVTAESPILEVVQCAPRRLSENRHFVQDQGFSTK